jgi:uncharacterized membrane protein YuzA (DUF378 family)
MIIVGLIIVGAINWGFTAFGWNLVDIFNKKLSKLFNLKLSIDKFIYIVIALCGLYLAFRRNTWLPFLGESVLPSSFVPLKEKKGNINLKINVEPNVKVAYWASNPGNNPKINVFDAYGKFENSGVVMSNEKGEANISVDKGTEYDVPSGRHLKSHVHYRILTDSSMMSEIKTIFV